MSDATSAAAPSVGRHDDVFEAQPGRLGRGASIALVVACQSAQSLSFSGIALFLPLIRRDIGLTFTEGGILAAVSQLTLALMQLPAGYLADRFGARRLFLIGVIGSNVLLITFAQLSDPTLLIANQAVAGPLRALVFAPGLLVISALFPPHRRATAMGLFIAGVFISTVLMNLIGPALVKVVGWRAIFVGAAALGLSLITVYRQFGAIFATAPATSPTISDLVGMFRRRMMWLLAGVQYVRVAMITGLGFWLPSFFVADKGLSLETTGVLVAAGAAFTAVSTPLGGYVSDRTRAPLAVIGASLAMLSVSTLLLPAATGLVPLLLLVIANSFFLNLYFGPLFMFPIQVLGRRTAGIATGFGNLFANVGGFTFAFVLGLTRDLTGSFTLGMLLLAALCAFGVACTLALAVTSRGAR